MMTWLEQIRSYHPDIGVVFYGNWLPVELANLPRRGFINYHPSPLPELRGLEPDTFAILEGRTRMWGTVHRISPGYDEGTILGKTRVMHLTPHDTPVRVLSELSRLGIDTIVETLDRLASNKGHERIQNNAKATDASRTRAYAESFVRWDKDDSITLYRRLRAFAGQDIGIRLKGRVDKRLLYIDDLAILKGRFPGRPGETIGRYPGPGRFRAQPIVRTADGIVVVRPGGTVRIRKDRPACSRPDGSPPVVIPPLARPSGIVRHHVMTGIYRIR